MTNAATLQCDFKLYARCTAAIHIRKLYALVRQQRYLAETSY